MAMISGLPISADAESAMGLEPEALGSLAWLVIQEQASGAKLETIANSLQVTVEDIVTLIEDTVNAVGDAAMRIWERGVVTIIAMNRANVNVISAGWNGLEAQALEKLNQKVRNTKGTGDGEFMLKVAAQANKAIRRNERAEGGSGGLGQAPILRTGNLGQMHLNLSVAVQNQLGGKEVKDAGVVVSTEDIQMLDLKATRALTESEEEKKGLTLDNSMTFEELVNE